MRKKVIRRRKCEPLMAYSFEGRDGLSGAALLGGFLYELKIETPEPKKKGERCHRPQKHELSA